VQKTLVEAWSIVTEAYVDQSYNGTEWDGELVAALTAVADAKNLEEGRAQIPQLLAKLGDPFTRWLPSRSGAAARERTGCFGTLDQLARCFWLDVSMRCVYI
jgi:hypothetical protein